jgi:hypothetical protein
MPVSIACDACGSRLKVPDHLAGRKVKCPKCGAAVAAPETGITAGPSHEGVAERPLPAKRPAPEERPEPEEREADRDEERPRRRKKKRRRQKAGGFEVPSWVWYVGGTVAFFVAAVGALVFAAVAGKSTQVIAFGVFFLIMLPISAVILIVSMVASSAIAGGIEFGEVHVVVPKAIALLVVVNLVSVLPFGFFLALPIWIVGLMALFKLDFWEARILFAVNWVLNTVVRLFLLAAVLSIVGHVGPDRPRPQLTGEQAGDLKALEALGADWDADEDVPGHPVVEISLAESRVTDADLVRLKSFPRLRSLDLSSTGITDAGLVPVGGLGDLESLDLSGTRVTDAGLARLHGLAKVRTVNLTGTRVTDAGVRQLRQALPQVQVVR